jgi:hypothetical protein
VWISSNYGDWEGGGTDVSRKLSELSIIIIIIIIISLFIFSVCHSFVPEFSVAVVTLRKQQRPKQH